MLVNQSAAVDTDVEQKVTVAADRGVINIHQLVDRFEPFILVCVIEPSRTNRYVALGRNPFVAVLVSPVKRSLISKAGKGAFVITIGPVGLACDPAFVTYPTNVGPGIAENNGIGFGAADGGEKTIEIIDHALFVVVRPVEPS